MLRRSVALRVYEKFEGVSGDKGHMTLQQACTIFGFQLNEEWNKKQVKKRFQKLALQFHPDHGGSSEQFQALREAQHILLTHRHDKHTDHGTPGEKPEVNFRRMNYDNLTNTIHRQTADREEYRSFSAQDFAVFVVFFSLFVVYYLYGAFRTQRQILRSRWSYTEEDIAAAKDVPHDTSNWHPWRADSATRDRMDHIGVLQGSMRQEVLDRKREQAPQVYMPWMAGGPLARHTVAYKPGGDQGETAAAAAVAAAQAPESAA